MEFGHAITSAQAFKKDTRPLSQRIDALIQISEAAYLAKTVGVHAIESVFM
jgi:hypothetical protein